MTTIHSCCVCILYFSIENESFSTKLSEKSLTLDSLYSLEFKNTSLLRISEKIIIYIDPRQMGHLVFEEEDS